MACERKVNSLTASIRIENVYPKVIDDETWILEVHTSRPECSEIFVFLAWKDPPFCRVRRVSGRQRELSEAEVKVFLSARPYFPRLNRGCSVFDTGKQLIC
jgi:hypothetical protein